MIIAQSAGALVGSHQIFAKLDGSVHTSGHPSAPVLSNGDLTYTQAQAANASAVATIGLTDQGKRYFEINRDSIGHEADNTTFGLYQLPSTSVVWVTQASTSMDVNGFVNDGAGPVNYGSQFNGRWGFLVNLETGVVSVTRNGVTMFTRTMGAHGAIYPFIQRGSSAGRAVSIETFNFGATDFVNPPGGGHIGWLTEI